MASVATATPPLYPYRRSPDQDADPVAFHPVVVVGAGPIGLAAAIDLAQQDVPVVVLDDNDRVSGGSRAICFAKRPLEILDRLGCGDRFVEKGVTWSVGKVFFDRRQVYGFDLLPEAGHKRPAFINLQQYYCEQYLVERIRALERLGKPIELRGRHEVVGVDPRPDRVGVEVGTPDGAYRLEAGWLLACDGAGSPVRRMLGADFVGRVFEDNFLIADVVIEADFPTERWFWFDPPFNRGQSALLHKQPDHIWRIDLQLGRDVDRDEQQKPENVIPRLEAMLGPDVRFELEWVSVYTFQCRRMEKFRHDRVIFAGDSAHQLSPFGGAWRQQRHPGHRQSLLEAQAGHRRTRTRASPGQLRPRANPGRRREPRQLDAIDRFHHPQVGDEPRLPRRRARPVGGPAVRPIPGQLGSPVGAVRA